MRYRQGFRQFLGGLKSRRDALWLALVLALVATGVRGITPTTTLRKDAVDRVVVLQGSRYHRQKYLCVAEVADRSRMDACIDLVLSHERSWKRGSVESGREPDFQLLFLQGEKEECRIPIWLGPNGRYHLGFDGTLRAVPESEMSALCKTLRVTPPERTAARR